jgi:hypothetical protein
MATTRFDPVLVQKNLAGADYPAHKDDLLQVALDNGAPDEVCVWLQGLPEREYESPTEVVEALSQEEET